MSGSGQPAPQVETSLGELLVPYNPSLGPLGHAKVDDLLAWQAALSSSVLNIVTFRKQV